MSSRYVNPPPAWQADLERAFRVLAALVRDEYPNNHSLAEIAEIWGDPSSADLAALGRVERELAELGVNVTPGTPDSPVRIGWITLTGPVWTNSASPGFRLYSSPDRPVA